MTKKKRFISMILPMKTNGNSHMSRMIALIQQSIRDDIFSLLNHDGSSKSVWEALRVKAEGGKQIKKNKIALLKKEFDLCKQKGHFKRECKNSEVDETEKPFNDDYYRKAIYHRSKEEPKMIENNPKEKSRACAVIHDDEGYDWSEILPEEDRVDDRFTAHGRTISKSKHHVFIAEIKERSREEILSEKTKRERFFVGCRIEKMQEEYEDAKYCGRYDKKRDCYVNRNGDSVVHRKEVIFDDVLAVIPLSGEYYSNVAKDKTGYMKRLDKIICDVMTVSLKNRDEERMKKNVDEIVNDLKKVAEEVKVETLKVKDVKIEEEEKVIKEVVEEKAIIEEQQDKKKEEEKEVKVESLAGVGGNAGTGEEKKEDADQTKTAEKAEVPITEVLQKTTECHQEEGQSSLARGEEVADP
ncbi:caldesmon-like [Helianthus annuus]|uniref:caldesmon-like n=1 Tax=Helianthus annuus TaxID=4232 RepID=UPI000B8F2BF3|nr:caldesmon-like [Helianthus annuus]